jgi:hypothetical protein
MDQLVRNPDPSLHEVRQKFGATVSDEELILRFFAGDDAVNALQTTAGPEYLDGTQPLVNSSNSLASGKTQPDLYQATRLLCKNGKKGGGSRDV